MDIEKIKAKAKKMYNLYKDKAAQETEEGQAALRMLNKFLRKHGIRNIEELISDKRKEFDIRYWSESDQSLIYQLLYCLFGDQTDEDGNKLKRTWHYRGGQGPSKVVIVRLTLAEFLEFTELYNFHRDKLWKELEKQRSIIYDAYVMAQDLYPSKGKVDPDKVSRSKGAEEMDNAMAAYYASKNMENHDMNFKDTSGEIEDNQKLLE